MNNLIEFTGIVKIKAKNLFISEDLTNEAATLAGDLNLIPLEPRYLHVTLLHQGVGGLKSLLKEEKKARKRGESIIHLPESVPLKDINFHRLEVARTGDRVSIKLLVTNRTQDLLAEWVSGFCRLNYLHRDQTEMQRHFHVSLYNLTGSPFDSVR